MAVVNCSSSYTISQRKNSIIFFHQFANSIKLFVKRILLIVIFHPGNHECSTLGDQTAVPEPLIAQAFDSIAIYTAVDGHKRDTIGKLTFNQFEQIFAIEFVRIVIFSGSFSKRLIEGHVANRQVAIGKYFPTDVIKIATC